MYTGVMIFPYLVRAVLLILGGPAVHGHHLMLHHGRPRGHVVRARSGVGGGRRRRRFRRLGLGRIRCRRVVSPLSEALDCRRGRRGRTRVLPAHQMQRVALHLVVQSEDGPEKAGVVEQLPRVDQPLVLRPRVILKPRLDLLLHPEHRPVEAAVEADVLCVGRARRGPNRQAHGAGHCVSNVCLEWRGGIGSL